MAKPSTTAPVDPILAELVRIKRLLVFALLKSGSSQTEAAAALGVAQSQISKMFPSGSANGGDRGKRAR